MKPLSSCDWRNRAGRVRWIAGGRARQSVIVVLLLLAPFRQALGAVAPAMNQRPGIYNVMDFGLTGHDILADTAAIQKAIDTCARNGGGQVVVPAGTEATIATVELKSHVDLHLERGALLRGSPHHGDFTRFALPPVWFEPGPVEKLGVIIYAEKAEDIAVTGAGRIDGNHLAYVTATGPFIYRCALARPFTVVFKECRHVLLRDVSLTNAAYWTLRLLGCDDAIIESIRIDADLKMPNNDGIDIDRSSNVRIHGCHITTGDDCISLKATPLSEGITRPCENVVISGCTLVSRSSGVVMGCDASGDIRDVVVSDCIIKDSHRGVAVRLSFEGTIERVLFSNLVIETKIFDPMWWGRGEPIQVVAMPWTRQSRLGVIRDIRFSNLICRSENGAVVFADEPGHIENISFDRVSILLDKTSAFAGGQQDFRPNETQPMPVMGTSGFLLRHAAGVTISDCSIQWGSHRPDYYEYALDAEACPQLAVGKEFTGDAAHPGMPAQRLK